MCVLDLGGFSGEVGTFRMRGYLGGEEGRWGYEGVWWGWLCCVGFFKRFRVRDR